MIDKIIAQVHQAKQAIARKSAIDRRAALLQLAKQLDSHKDEILAANLVDLEKAKKAQYDDAFIDRMTLTPARVDAMVTSVREVAGLKDTLGRVYETTRPSSGIITSKMRVPIGVILMIYESRPNVTIEAASLAIKSGNVIILKGGSETVQTNAALAKVIKSSFAATHFPANAVEILTSNARELAQQLLTRDDAIDLVIPRGSKRLLSHIKEHSKIPTLLHLEGNCHIYIDKSADVDMATSITINAKTQRFGVCNALETLLVHESIAAKVLPPIAEGLVSKGVELRGDKAARLLIKGMKATTEKDWSTEYLAPILAIKIVHSARKAIDHINEYGSGHTDAIITSDQKTANAFIQQVDSSSVMHNTSTRFADGFEYGLGAEIGISTGKLHARGPVGLEGLTTYKWIVKSNGAIRT